MSDWVVRLIDQTGYLGVGFLMFLETVFPPIPSEVIMSVAGVAAAQGKMHYAGVVASGTAGAMLGNTFWYLAARALGVQRLKPLIDRFGRYLTLNWREVERAERWMRDYGIFLVFLGRLLPTIRSLISIPAGLLKMRFKSFLIASTVGTALWTALLAGAGYKLGTHIDEIERIIGPVSSAIILLLLAAYVWRLVRGRGQDNDQDASDPDREIR